MLKPKTLQATGDRLARAMREKQRSHHATAHLGQNPNVARGMPLPKRNLERLHPRRQKALDSGAFL
jgi:hypothetical protein